MPPLRERKEDIPLPGRALPRQAPLQPDAPPGAHLRRGDAGAAAVRLAGQRARAGERHRARRGHVAGRHHHQPSPALLALHRAQVPRRDPPGAREDARWPTSSPRPSAWPWWKRWTRRAATVARPPAAGPGAPRFLRQAQRIRPQLVGSGSRITWTPPLGAVSFFGARWRPAAGPASGTNLATSAAKGGKTCHFYDVQREIHDPNAICRAASHEMLP